MRLDIRHYFGFGLQEHTKQANSQCTMFCAFHVKFIVIHIQNVLLNQAQDVRTNEVVAIKKMSYSGKQSTEVRLGLYSHIYS